MMSPTEPLRKTHPSLFRSLVVKALFLLLLSVILIGTGGEALVEPEVLQEADVLRMEFWGALFGIAGLMLTYGVTNGTKRYKWAKRGLLMASIVAGLFGVAYILTYLQGTVDTVLPALFWSFVSLTTAVWVPEPAFNPLASIINQKSKEN